MNTNSSPPQRDSVSVRPAEPVETLGRPSGAARSPTSRPNRSFFSLNRSRLTNEQRDRRVVAVRAAQRRSSRSRKIDRWGRPVSSSSKIFLCSRSYTAFSVLMSRATQVICGAPPSPTGAAAGWRGSGPRRRLGEQGEVARPPASRCSAGNTSTSSTGRSAGATSSKADSGRATGSAPSTRSRRPARFR